LHRIASADAMVIVISATKKTQNAICFLASIYYTFLLVICMDFVTQNRLATQLGWQLLQYY